MNNADKLRRILDDPILWIETFVNIVDKESKVVPFKLNPQQKYILKNKGKFNICLKSRQLGITSVALAYALYIALTKPNTTCMIMSYSMRGVDEIFEKLKIMYANLPACVSLPAVKDNKTEIKFSNNSRIINCTCGSKDNARGSTLNFVHLSEVAFMNENLEKQMTAIEQALVADGCMILESTANGMNYFSELWNKTVSGEAPLWKPFFFSFVQDQKMFSKEYREYKERYKAIYGKYLTEKELDDKERTLFEKGATLEQLMWRRLKISNSSEEKFCQEYPSNPIEAFVTTGSNVFNSFMVAERMNSIYKTERMALPSDVDPIIRKYSNYLSIWKLPVKGKKFFIGVDVGEGLASDNDYSVISILDEDLYQCLEWRSNRVKPWEFSELVYKIALWYSKGLLVIEKASAGNTVVDRIKNTYHYINMFKYKAYDMKSGRSRRKVGWETNVKSKPIMISDMQEAFETGQCMVNSPDLLREMKLYVSNDGKMQAASGHDDTVMAYALAIQGQRSGQYFYPFRE